MDHHSSKHSPGQHTNPDAAGVLALFTDAVRDHLAASRRGAHAAADGGRAGSCPHGVDNSDVQSDLTSDTTIRCDIELARIALGLHLSALFRLWLILHEIARQTNAQAFTRVQLDAALQTYGVNGCAAYITRLLSDGAGRFWRIDAAGCIFPRGYISLCKELTRQAIDDGLPHLLDHLPGTRKPMYVNVSGSMKDFEAQIVAAWYECHNNPTVSRFLLERWFNRSDVTLRKLERRARVEKTYNTAETLEPSAIPLNATGELRFHRQRKNKRGQTVYSFQLPNTYRVRNVRQHPYRGQGRKAAALIRQQLASLVTGLCEAGDSDNFGVPGDDNRGRLYYADYKRVRQARRKGRAGVVYSPARPGGVRHTVWDVWV